MSQVDKRTGNVSSDEPHVAEVASLVHQIAVDRVADEVQLLLHVVHNITQFHRWVLLELLTHASNSGLQRLCVLHVGKLICHACSHVCVHLKHILTETKSALTLAELLPDRLRWEQRQVSLVDAVNHFWLDALIL